MSLVGWTAILDLDLGDGSGVDLFDALRAGGRSLAVAFFSAGASPEDLRRAAERAPSSTTDDLARRRLGAARGHEASGREGSSASHQGIEAGAVEVFRELADVDRVGQRLVDDHAPVALDRERARPRIERELQPPRAPRSNDPRPRAVPPRHGAEGVAALFGGSAHHQIDPRHAPRHLEIVLQTEVVERDEDVHPAPVPRHELRRHLDVARIRQNTPAADRAACPPPAAVRPMTPTRTHPTSNRAKAANGAGPAPS